MGHGATIAAADAAPRTLRIDRVPLFGTGIDRVTMFGAIDCALDWIDEPPPRRPAACRYVLTPNVDHVVMMRTNEALRDAYRDASLVIADGWPIVRASKWLGRPLPERVPGSDLVPNLFEATAERGALRVFLLGGKPGVGERAAARIERRWKHVAVVGTHSPPFGFEKQPEACQRIEQLVREANPELLVVGFGAPKQELWLHRHAPRLAAKVAIGAGATIDFLAGEQTRAPRWVQSLGMEWFYRAARNPRRLAGRYARDLVVFPRLCVEEWAKGAEGRN